MKKVIFDGKTMEVLHYDEDFGTVEVPVILRGQDGEYCPLHHDLSPIVAILQGDLIVESDFVEGEALLIWSGISLLTLFVFHFLNNFFGWL